ncbi:PREDICTED: peroxidase 66-like [Camelina sativa]|uniref:Peroxidase n=1 Tax=Camelina sativa TaxID=90675 RepID=A0ABM0UP87_CAMSA|nr:PREDICTED: peroxidase 66-like [Camelina sativa]
MAFSKALILALIFVVFAIVKPSEGSLNAHFYDQSCPTAEKIILDTVRNASLYDPKVPARLLRMFFHDCFIRGCDASILLDSVVSNQAEKDGPPNISVRSFYVIEDAKKKLEKACPRTVSCADVIAIAARDVVTLSGGPYWSVLKGRKDGTVSLASESTNLPPPTFNVSQLIQSFAARGLSVKDMVTLSGGHTIGFSHCSSFEPRLQNFSKIHDIDPSMNYAFAQTLKKKCPRSTNRDKNAGTFMDSTGSVFDNVYYKQILSGKGVFVSDQTLLGDSRTKKIVEKYAQDQKAFFREFAAAMVKLGNVGVKKTGQVRVNPRFIN